MGNTQTKKYVGKERDFHACGEKTPF